MKKYQGNFTEYFSQFLLDKDYINVVDGVPSVKEGALSILDAMPTDANGVSFKDRFIRRNYFKEIGSETEECFEMHLHNAMLEVVEDWKWRIETFENAYEHLLERYVATHSTYDTTNSGKDSTTSKEYYKPVNDNAETIVSKDTDELEHGKHVLVTVDEQKAIAWSKSVPEVLKASLALEDVYSKALESMDNIFMKVF